MKFCSVNGGLPVCPENVDTTAVRQRHKPDPQITWPSISPGSACRCFGVDKHALFCYICAGLETRVRVHKE
jgi:hypothetical protein